MAPNLTYKHTQLVKGWDCQLKSERNNLEYEFLIEEMFIITYTMIRQPEPAVQVADKKMIYAMFHYPSQSLLQ